MPIRLDTDQILAQFHRDLELAARIHDDPAHAAGGVRNALVALMGSASYLDHALKLGAPLPAEWAEAQLDAMPVAELCDEAWRIIANAGWEDSAKSPGWQQVATAWREKYFANLLETAPTTYADLTGTADRRGAAADEQLAHLRRARDAVAATLPPLDQDETEAKIGHLVACVSAVDDMCCRGLLPAEWLPLPEYITTLPATAVVPFKVDARPVGIYGRLELPGRREWTGWITSEERFGVTMCVVRDWDGIELVAAQPGPNAAVVKLIPPGLRPGTASRWDEQEGDPFAEEVEQREPPF